MKKKQYIRPVLSVYQVNACEVICGSGKENGTITSGNGNQYTDGNTIYGESCQRRGGWDEYEGR